MDLSNENIIHVKKNGIEYLQFKILLDYGVINCYTTRINNFSLKSDISKEEKTYNYERICKCLGIEKETIVRPKQEHTDIIERVDNVGKKYDNTDGLITNKKGINLCLCFADCTPVLIYDPINKAIANIHSGWKGTVQKIAQKAVLKMIKEYGSKPENLIVCIGPCIKEDHFEVRDDVREIFEKEFSYLNKNVDVIKPKENEEGKYLINTTLINQLILQEVGVKEHNIYDSKICTVCNSDILHSYRVDREKSGRNATIIGMK